MNNKSLPVVVKRQFSSPPQGVFAAFASADIIAGWLSPDRSIKMTVLSMSFKPQGGFRFQFDESSGERNVVGGVFSQIDDPEKLVFSWIWEAPHQFAGIDTQVTVEFIGQLDGTEVVLTHEKLPSDIACDMHKLGWEGALSQLGGAL